MLRALLTAKKYSAIHLLLAGLLACAYLWANMAGGPLPPNWADAGRVGWPTIYLGSEVDIFADDYGYILALFFLGRALNVMFFPIGLVFVLEVCRGATLAWSRATSGRIRWIGLLRRENHRGVRRCFCLGAVMLATLSGSGYILANMLPAEGFWGGYSTGWPFEYCRSSSLWITDDTGAIRPWELMHSPLLMWINIALFLILLAVVVWAVQGVVDLVTERATTPEDHSRAGGPAQAAREAAQALVAGAAGGAALHVVLLSAATLTDIALLRLMMERLMPFPARPFILIGASIGIVGYAVYRARAKWLAGGCPTA